jgi:hypothetical protein
MRTYIFYHCLKDNIIELKETGLLIISCIIIDNNVSSKGAPQKKLLGEGLVRTIIDIDWSTTLSSPNI